MQLLFWKYSLNTNWDRIFFWFNVVFQTRISHKHDVKYGMLLLNYVQHGNWCAKDEIQPEPSLLNFHQKEFFVTKVNKRDSLLWGCNLKMNAKWMNWGSGYYYCSEKISFSLEADS